MAFSQRQVAIWHNLQFSCLANDYASAAKGITAISTLTSRPGGTGADIFFFQKKKLKKRLKN